MSDAPFLERIFESGDRTIAAHFLQPTLEPGGEYQCRWAIFWPDRVRQSYSCGLDGVQALMLAMSGRLTYVNQYDLDLPPGWGEGELYRPPE